MVMIPNKIKAKMRLNLMQKKTTNKVEMPSPMIKNRSNKVSVLVVISFYLGVGAKY